MEINGHRSLLHPQAAGEAWLCGCPASTNRVKWHRSDIFQCFDRALAANSTIPFFCGAPGRVQRRSFCEDSLRRAHLVNCLDSCGADGHTRTDRGAVALCTYEFEQGAWKRSHFIFSTTRAPRRRLEENVDIRF